MKKYLLILTILLSAVLNLAMISAQDEEVDLEANKAVSIRHFEEYWGQANFEIADEIFASDFLAHNPFGGDMDILAYEDYVQGIHDGATDFLVEIGIIIADGDWVARTFYMEGISTNEWAGLSPTGELWTLNGITVHRMKDGKIAHEWSFFDSMNLLQQLNAVPFEGEVPNQVRMDVVLDDPSPEDIAVLIDGWMELIDDQDAAVDLLSEDMVVHEPLAFFPEDISGREAVIGWLGGIRVAMPDFNIVLHPDTEELTMIAEGNLVLMMAELQFTFDQEMLGIPPNGVLVRVPVADLFRFENGRFAEAWIRYDTMNWINLMMSTFPTGTFFYTASGEERILLLNPDGTFEWRIGDRLVTDGTYSVIDNQLTWVTDRYCADRQATYTWTFADGVLIFDVVDSDPCADRQTVTDGISFALRE